MQKLLWLLSWKCWTIKLTLFCSSYVGWTGTAFAAAVCSQMYFEQIRQLVPLKRIPHQTPVHLGLQNESERQFPLPQNLHWFVTANTNFLCSTTIKSFTNHEQENGSVWLSTEKRKCRGKPKDNRRDHITPEDVCLTKWTCQLEFAAAWCFFWQFCFVWDRCVCVGTQMACGQQEIHFLDAVSWPVFVTLLGLTDWLSARKEVNCNLLTSDCVLQFIDAGMELDRLENRPNVAMLQRPSTTKPHVFHELSLRMARI